MKNTIIIILGVLVLMAVTLGIKSLYPCGGEQMAWSMMGECGGGDMQGHGGATMGHGDMSSHAGHQHGEHQQSQPLTPGQARTVLENHLNSTNNPALILGEISEGQDYFKAEIRTKDGTVVDKLQVDRTTGFLSSANETKPKIEEHQNPAAPQGHVH